jgi:outer membrane protein
MRRMLTRIALLAGAAIAAPALAAPDTLEEALASAYQTNPTLQGARAAQRAVDEGVPLARAEGLPEVTATPSYIEFVKQSSNNFTAPERLATVGVDLGVPI